MANVVVVGAGIGGLTTAMLLAGDGHDVTVLERDPATPPADPQQAWAAWERRGVNQFRLLHFFQPRFSRLVETELPAIPKALDEFGALRFNVLREVPDFVSGGWREGDEEYEAITGRRPVVEAAVAKAATDADGVTVRRGVAVEGLVTDGATANGAPHVVGVRTEDGEEIRADLVVDAGGRRSPLPRWLTDIGAKPGDEELEDSGFMYYGRHFRSKDGSTPAVMAPLLSHYGSVSVLTLPADNGTWGVGVITSAKDAAARGLRDLDRWNEVLGKFPMLAHWLDGEPLEDGVTVMAKIEDRHRSYVVDGQPVATGVVAVADSWACTNPSVGRGATMGTMHALALRDVTRSTDTSDVAGFVRAWDQKTNETVEPWYRATLHYDRHRLAESEAAIEGKSYDAGDPVWDITRALQHGSNEDPDLLRAFLRVASMLSTPDEVLADPSILDKVIAVGDTWRDAPFFGPTREEFESIVAR